jgi:hypothetical protein
VEIEFPPENWWVESGKGVTSMEFGTDEIYDGPDVVAPGAAAAEAQFAAHQVTFVAAPLAQETFIARWAFVHGLGDS